MYYDIYRYIFIGGAALSVIMLIVSIILFFTLRIPKVIGDLTGATARKAIQNIREQNEKTGDKAYKVSPINLERGKLTDKISPSGNLVPQSDSHMGAGVATEKIGTDRLAPAHVEETDVLSINPLSSETTVLEQRDVSTPAFVVEYEITYIFSNEVISL